MFLRPSLLALVLVVPLFAAEPGSGLEDLEAIVSGHASLSAFLSDDTALKQYSAALKKYYGRDRFDCHTFDQAVEELKTATAASPELGDALWERRDGERTFRISIANNKQVYTARRPRRALHALWSGSQARRCPAADCHSTDALAPQKYAVAVRGSVWTALEENGAFRGTSVLLMPMARDGQTILVGASMGPSLDKRTESFRISTSAKVFQGRLFHAVTTGVRDSGWVDKTLPVAEVARATPAGKIPKVMELPEPGQKARDFGELNTWRIADPSAARYAALDPRVCRPLAGKSGDLFSSFGNVNGRTEPAPKMALTSGSPSLSPADKVIGEVMTQAALGSSGKTIPSEKVKEYEMVLTGLLGSKDPGDRARAAYTLGALHPTPISVTINTAPRKAPKQKDLTPTDMALFRSLNNDPAKEVQAYASLALAQRGFDSPDVRKGLNSFESSKPNHSKNTVSLDLSAGGKFPQFDPIARDLDVEYERERRDLPRASKAAERAFERMKKEPDPEAREDRMDRLLDVYFRSKSTRWMRAALNELALEDPQLAQEFMRRAQQRAEPCDKEKKDSKSEKVESKAGEQR